MGDQGLVSSLPPSPSPTTVTTPDIIILATLKFLISNIKNLIPNQLTIEKYAIWRTQILQQFSANGYAGHLSGSTTQPSDATFAEHTTWNLIDSNLISTLFSTITPSILPYVITASTAQEIWKILEHRLQPSSRSRVLQLKNELHHVQMKNLSMQQYLSHIKNIVDTIAASGSKIDHEDIILHSLNELQLPYNSFKAAFRTSSLPADLDNLYSLMCSEEIHVNQELLKDQSATALYASSCNQTRNRNQKQSFKNKNGPPRPPISNQTPSNTVPSTTTRPTCQICGKTGHIAINCWHRCNFKYAPTTTSGSRILKINDFFFVVIFVMAYTIYNRLQTLPLWLYKQEPHPLSCGMPDWDIPINVCLIL
ncbi:uncharacterized protein LOC110106810 [Dendrobium catenatum]|uniref:uncharacterized protein LOC110106810 n=1 Tax=Dendrobium catenatum TaxID=906689 RepID=UPI0009F29ACD|nr:uncharacterized protein LOC110106810 [Dendrobium catenatum]